jgi:hypothetical protein
MMDIPCRYKKKRDRKKLGNKTCQNREFNINIPPSKFKGGIYL